MQDDRADLIAGVHACLLSHLSASRAPAGLPEAAMHARVPLSPLAASPLNFTPPARTPSGNGGSSHAYDLSQANAEAIQVSSPRLVLNTANNSIDICNRQHYYRDVTHEYVN